jgi:PAS domain S-box-containing protein
MTRDVRVDAAPLRDMPAGVIVASTMTRNSSSDKHTVLASREGELRHQFLTSASPVMIWMAKTDKLCYYFNKEWLDFVGRTLQQESGNGWVENVHPDDLDRCLLAYAHNFDARRPFEMEYRMRHHTGQYRWVFNRGIPRYAVNGTFEGYVGACPDINDTKQATETLRIAEETMRLMKSSRRRTAAHRS